MFEPVVQEEARHILFFVNWVAWNFASKSLLPCLWFRARCMAALIAAGFSRLSLVGAADHGKSDANFVVAGGETLTVGLTPRRLLEVALDEDAKRMTEYDPRLPRPRIMPFLAKLVLKFMPRD